MAPSTKVKKPASGDAKKAVRTRKQTRNPVLTSGVLKYSRTQVFRRKKFLRLKQKKVKKNPATKVEKKKVPVTVVKKIGGAKNGGERVVLVKKPKAYYPTKARVASRGPHGLFKTHKRNTRKSLKPGRVVIMIAGHHAGKRVVFLKTLKSGLLLVNGPFFVNGCPLRRVSQNYVMATQTRLKLKNYRVPDHIDDKYFKRIRKSEKKKAGEGDIFATKKEKYVPSEQRKADQLAVDQKIKEVIRAEPERKMIFKYLNSMFGLKSSQYPHRMRF